MSGVNSGDTAWMIVSTALVMLMTPGLAFFYGGLVRRKNVLSIMMRSAPTTGDSSAV
jgi:Amt family ammonium transporter